MLVFHRPFVCASSVLHQKRNIEHNNEYPIQKTLKWFLKELMLKSGDGTSCDVANIETCVGCSCLCLPISLNMSYKTFLRNMYLHV